MNKIIIEPSKYLDQEVEGYYHTIYYRRDNPFSTTGFLTDLKNDISYVPPQQLAEARKRLAEVLTQDFCSLLAKYGDITICGIPRAKREGHYRMDQMGLRDTISMVAKSLPGVTDGTHYIIRHTDTRTTHRDKSGHGGFGEKPRPGLLQDTCSISLEIANKTIVLVDDIYTPGIGIDEDGIQAVRKAGAKKVIFYAVARAAGNGSGFHEVYPTW